jgi:aminoglycoside phosphotransferase (APT) family kinase protein
MTQVHGDIERGSRLYAYLKGPFERIARLKRASDLYAKRLGGSHQVYLIRDQRSHRKFILKSFYSPGLPPSVSDRRMNKEYRRLKRFHSLGIDESWFEVVQPLGKSDSGRFFVEEYVRGQTLGEFMKKAFADGDDKALYDQLTMFSGYLALLHKKTRRSSRVRTAYVRKELYEHAEQSHMAGATDLPQLQKVMLLIDRACTYPMIRDVHRCLVHGDANPSNFLFHDGHMYVIDVERSGYRDPVYDTGMMAGELCHYAMLYTGNPYLADPFIGHMYWVYAGNFSDQYAKFIQVTRRNPLYMANSLLRISRNGSLDVEYRRRLAYHAVECLKSLKKFNE